MIKLLDWQGPAHAFVPHFHAEFFVSVTLEGVCEFECEGRQFQARARQLSIIPPFHVHAANCVAGVRYKGVYLDAQWMRRWLPDCRCGLDGRWETPHVVDDVGLADALIDAFARTDEDAISALAATIIGRHARIVADEVSSVAWRSRVVFLMQEFAAERSSIAKIANAMGMSRQGFARAFRRHFGVTAVFFRKQLRLQAAEQLLLHRTSPAMTAVSSGFSDQAHLHRELKAARGVSPSRYTRHYYVIG